LFFGGGTSPCRFERACILSRATTRSELRALLGFGARLRLCSRFQGGGFTRVRRCCGLRFGLVAQPYLMRGLGLHLRALAGFDCESGFRLNTLASERCGLLLELNARLRGRGGFCLSAIPLAQAFRCMYFGVHALLRESFRLLLCLPPSVCALVRRAFRGGARTRYRLEVPFSVQGRPRDFFGFAFRFCTHLRLRQRFPL